MIDEILQVLGVHSHRLLKDRLEIPDDPGLAKIVQELPPDDGILAIDLDTTTGLSKEQLSALKQWQCSKIAAFRAEAYKVEADGLFFGSEADGDNKQAWLDKRAEIKARYPWPGSYRS